MSLVAGAIAALISWFFNKAALKLSGSKVIIFLVPFIEEAAKSILAIIFQAPFIFTHLIFGMIEAVFDQLNSKNGFWAGLVSVLGHTFFGYVTYFVYNTFASFFLGIFSGYLVHMLWNLFVMEYVVIRKRRKRT